MRILVVKLTSMGDVLHLLPALSDLKRHHHDIVVDWMVEESFADLPEWHHTVDRVIPVATRRWRKQGLRALKEFFKFRQKLREIPYDVVVDAQGLVKSAVFSRMAKLRPGGSRSGFSGDSIKESPAAWFYSQRISVARELHAVDRLRLLFAAIFAYSVRNLDMAAPDYALTLKAAPLRSDRKQLLFFHGTTWQSKHLPESIWRELIDLADEDGYEVKLAWGSSVEYKRAQSLAEGCENASVLNKLSLNELGDMIASVHGAIAVDTGLGHMAAALGVPCVSIYGSTDSRLTGAKGSNQRLLQSEYACSPCMLKSCDKLSKPSDDPPCYLDSSKNGGISASSIWASLVEQMSLIN